ncbi:MAG: response regulator transcription factor [Chloroflexota bacterium]|nr:response regulator transcription factor [Chloroflexota bacterium]
MTRLRVFIVDDQEIVRSGLRRLIDLEAGLEVVGEAASGEEALQKVPQAQPHIILLDIRMPGIDGIRLIPTLKETLPDAKLLVISAYVDDYAAAISAGASGYLAKDISGEELIRAVRSAASGQSPIYLSVPTDRLSSLLSDRPSSYDIHLSSRQLKVLRLIAQGESNAEIARELFLSERTIKREVSEIFQEMGVSNRAEAVAQAYEHHWI